MIGHTNVDVNLKKLGERIKDLRGEMQQAEFADRWGVHKNSLSNYEKGLRSPSLEKIYQLLEMYPEVSPGWLLTGEDPGLSMQTVSATEGYVVFQHYEIDTDAAGSHRHIESDQIVDSIAFKEEWLDNALCVPGGDLAMIKVKGDGMAPSLNDGDLVLVDLRGARIEDSAIYVLEFGGSLLVKRIQRRLDGSVVIKCDNPHYETEIFSQEQAESLKIVGRAVWAGRRL